MANAGTHVAPGEPSHTSQRLAPQARTGILADNFELHETSLIPKRYATG